MSAFSTIAPAPSGESAEHHGAVVEKLFSVINASTAEYLQNRVKAKAEQTEKRMAASLAPKITLPSFIIPLTNLPKSSGKKRKSQSRSSSSAHSSSSSSSSSAAIAASPGKTNFLAEVGTPIAPSTTVVLEQKLGRGENLAMTGAADVDHSGGAEAAAASGVTSADLQGSYDISRGPSLEGGGEDEGDENLEGGGEEDAADKPGPSELTMLRQAAQSLTSSVKKSMASSGSDDSGNGDVLSCSDSENEFPAPRPTASKVAIATYSSAHAPNMNMHGLSPASQDLGHHRLLSNVPLAPTMNFRNLDATNLGQRKRRLLIVDDTRTIRVLMDRVFSHNGFEVDTAPNGKHALSMMQNRMYDLVFLDIEMPVMNGYRCAQYIRSWEKQMQRDRQLICALTSHSSAAEKQLAKISGMDEFKGKPTPIKTLLEWVNAMFGGDSKEKTKYQVGDIVEVRDRDISKLELYFPATVLRVNPDSTFDVVHEDGGREPCVREARLRKPLGSHFSGSLRQTGPDIVELPPTPVEASSRTLGSSSADVASASSSAASSSSSSSGAADADAALPQRLITNVERTPVSVGPLHANPLELKSVSKAPGKIGHNLGQKRSW
mmetsp:Transcript_89811/g.256760  ORF Transcript_89811/g.256760 Transcript_89811/m.256760 type:complete len:605 (-) Transcript_89811:255-2069(-)